jgi:hypothetical protein
MALSTNMKQTKPEDATLGATVREALRLAALMKAEGVPKAEIDATLERTLRAAWPFVREWKYECDVCSDTGWEIRECREGARCGRPQRIGPAFIGGYANYTGMGRRCSLEPSYTHTYAQPCHCRRGYELRGQITRALDPPAPSDVTPSRRKGHVRP